VLRSIQVVHDANKPVMPGLDPGIHASAMGGTVRGEDADGRDKPGHDDDVDHVFESENCRQAAADQHWHGHATCFRRGEGGLVVLSSCGHAGIINTLRRCFAGLLSL